eukprot:TRINITY_DN13633_c0_g1_i1.p2 TRINITY_DN13633_c0_g1~~TRINITY_DN13633_c0_g1_i1.p2  ORF type:complete len:104 (+),score=1.05 TRINITY_DN13633_c0_g1_i1:141-452(+)
MLEPKLIYELILDSFLVSKKLQNMSSQNSSQQELISKQLPKTYRELIVRKCFVSVNVQFFRKDFRGVGSDRFLRKYIRWSAVGAIIMVLILLPSLKLRQFGVL